MRNLGQSGPESHLPMKKSIPIFQFVLAAGLFAGGDHANSISAQEQRSALAVNAPVAPAPANSTNAGSPPPAKPRASEAKSATSSSWEKLVMRPFRDAQGTLLVEMPFPTSWKLLSRTKPGEPSIEGPNGVKVVDYPLQSFLFSRDPQMQQLYQQTGQRVRALPSVEDLVQQDVRPWAEKRGLKFVKQYEVPEISRMDRWYSDQLYKAMPTQSQITAIGSEWESDEGERCFVLMHLNAGASLELQTWSYYCTSLQADKAHFETARRQFIFALANARYNLAPIAAYNQLEAQKAGQSWAAHNARMAQNQANFAASQRDFVNRSSSAHDALMKSWQERNAASDRTQEQFVDTITERTKVANPASGQLYKLESGHNHYWMNSDGRYLSSDKQDYDPNLDERLNNQKWEELKKVKY
jgi:hypothetical protein